MQMQKRSARIPENHASSQVNIRADDLDISLPEGAARSNDRRLEECSIIDIDLAAGIDRNDLGGRHQRASSRMNGK